MLINVRATRTTYGQRAASRSQGLLRSLTVSKDVPESLPHAAPESES
jgi:hypothetical protein